MKNAIIKFLGLDKIQAELQSVQKENADLRFTIQDTKRRFTELYSEFHGIDWDTIARDNISISDIAEAIDLYELVDYIETSDIASHIDTEDLARSIDYYELAEHIDYENLQNQMTDALDIDILAQTVSEKIADRDGMHQLISEEIDNQGSGNISTDAVQSMIDSAIQQFADSLEVMVSAKLNINK